MLEYKVLGNKNQNISSLRPFFDGSDYPYWKFKMQLYLNYDSIKLWDIIRKGWKPPKATNNDVHYLTRSESQKQKGYDHFSLLYVKRRRRKASTLHLSQGNMKNLRESL